MATEHDVTPVDTELGQVWEGQGTAHTRSLMVVHDPGSPETGSLLMTPGPDGVEPPEPDGPELIDGLPAARASVLRTEVEQELLNRWDAIQNDFADDPRACVQNADVLIEEISAALVKGIGEHRARLAAGWQNGRPEVHELAEELQEYRVFIRTLLPGYSRRGTS